MLPAAGAAGGVELEMSDENAADVEDNTAPPELTLTDWPVDAPRDWVERVNRPQTAAEVEAIAQSIRRGQPFGSPTWQARTAKRLGLESTFRPRGRPRKNPDGRG
jgi:hypothetical protein